MASDILQHFFGITQTDLPITAPRVHLWIGDPGPSLVTGAEVSGGGYVPVQTTIDQWVVLNPTSNDEIIAFPEATAYWGTVTHVVLTTNLGFVGYPLFYGPLTTPKEIDEGSIARFKIGMLQITLI